MGIANAVTVLSHQLIILHRRTPVYWAAQGGRTDLAEDSGDHDPEAEDVRHGQVENEGQDEGRRWQPIAGKLKFKSFITRRRQCKYSALPRSMLQMPLILLAMLLL